MASKINTEINWQPSSTYDFRPALIVLCGPISDSDARFIQDGVQDRLGDQVPYGTVQWGRFRSAKEISEDAVAALVDPLQKLKLWDDLLARGYIRSIPAQLCLQVIVVYELAGSNDAKTAHSLLQSLASTAEKVLSKGIEYSLALIVLGNGAIDLSQLTPYWPRIRLQTEAQGGLVISHDRMLEEAQTLAVALITSELSRAINHMVG